MENNGEGMVSIGWWVVGDVRALGVVGCNRILYICCVLDAGCG